MNFVRAMDSVELQWERSCSSRSCSQLLGKVDDSLQEFSFYGSWRKVSNSASVAILVK